MRSHETADMNPLEQTSEYRKEKSMNSEMFNPEASEAMKTVSEWKPSPADDGEEAPVATGVVTCRYIDKRKCTVTRWEAHWALSATLETEEGSTAKVDFHGRTTDLKAKITAVPDGTMLLTCEEKGVRVPLGRLDNVSGNRLRLSVPLGVLESITVSECLKDLERAVSFEGNRGNHVHT